MKYRPAVEWNALHLASGRWIGPLLGALGQPNKIRDADRGLVGKKGASQFAKGSINDRGWLCCCRSRRFFRRRFSSRRGGLSNYLNG